VICEVTEPHRPITADACFELEISGDTRYELVKGVLNAQAATSVAHAELLPELGGWLRRAARSAGCRATSGAAVVISESTVYVPDLVMDCEPVDALDQSIARPTIIVEILLPSTARIDRGEKLDRYRSLESLLVYLVVYQDTMRIDRHWRDDAAAPWQSLVSTGGAVPLPSLNAVLSLDDLYRGLELANA